MLKFIIKYTLVPVICMLIGFEGTLAQENIHSIKTLHRNYIIKVKQLSEFIDRFNFQKDFLNRDIGSDFKSMITRDEYIRLLFNDEDKRMDPEVKDDTYRILVDMFIHEICDNSIYIDRHSENIYAELTCQVSIGGKNGVLNLLLRQEIDNGLKWSIVSVDQNLVQSASNHKKKPNDEEKNDSSKFYIPPLSNETNFIDLKVLLDDHHNLDKLSSKDCVEENVSDFFLLIRKGALKYHHVKSIRYHILDIPGWIIVVTNFQRDTSNSGWLIADLLLKDDVTDYFYDKYAYSAPMVFQKY